MKRLSRFPRIISAERFHKAAPPAQFSYTTSALPFDTYARQPSKTWPIIPQFTCLAEKEALRYFALSAPRLLANPVTSGGYKDLVKSAIRYLLYVGLGSLRASRATECIGDKQIRFSTETQRRPRHLVFSFLCGAFTRRLCHCL